MLVRGTYGAPQPDRNRMSHTSCARSFHQGKEELAMRSRLRHSADPTIDRVPLIRPTWMTWLWLAFIVAVIAFTIIGFWGNTIR